MDIEELNDASPDVSPDYAFACPGAEQTACFPSAGVQSPSQRKGGRNANKSISSWWDKDMPSTHMQDRDTCLLLEIHLIALLCLTEIALLRLTDLKGNDRDFWHPVLFIPIH